MQVIKYSLVAALTIIFFCCASGLNGKALMQVAAPTQQNVEVWAGDNYGKVLDSVLPNGNIELGRYPNDVRWITTVRIVPSSEDLEFGFSVHRSYDGKVKALISAPKGVRIMAQLRELRRGNPNANLEQIINLVAIKRQTLTQEKCPQLTRLAREFEALKISPVLNDELVLDAVGYVVWSQARWGHRMEVWLGGPGPNARRQRYSLIQWVENFRSASKVCLGNDPQ